MDIWLLLLGRATRRASASWRRGSSKSRRRRSSSSSSRLLRWRGRDWEDERRWEDGCALRRQGRRRLGSSKSRSLLCLLLVSIGLMPQPLLLLLVSHLGRVS